MKPNPIEEMFDICNTLIEMIDVVGVCPDLISMQETFSETVENAMKAYQRGEIDVDIRMLPPAMYAFATEELPVLCAGNPDDLRRAKQQLKLFIASMNELTRSNKAK